MRGRPKIYASDAERQTARRIRRYAAGLNSQGKPYGRHPNFVNHADAFNVPDQKRAQRKRKLATNLASYERTAAMNRALGLRVDGVPFKRWRNYHAWQQFKQENF